MRVGDNKSELHVYWYKSTQEGPPSISPISDSHTLAEARYSVLLGF